MAKPKAPEANYFSLDPRQQRLFAATPPPPAVVVDEPAPENTAPPPARREPARKASPTPVQSTIHDVIRRRTSA